MRDFGGARRHDGEREHARHEPSRWNFQFHDAHRFAVPIEQTNSSNARLLGEAPMNEKSGRRQCGRFDPALNFMGSGHGLN
jgi:hypothetical protein